MKKALTFTMIGGGKACPNDCPICISKMTPDLGIGLKEPEIDWDKFAKSVTIAVNHKAETALISSKGEATLSPGQTTKFLFNMYGKPFDKRELQTEGSLLAKGGLYDDFLDVWKELDLETVAISIYHYEREKNKEIFRPKSGKYFDLERLIEKIHKKKMKTRLSCVMLDGYIDNVEETQNLINFAKKNGVYQLTLRRADAPKNPLDKEAAECVKNLRIDHRDKRYKRIHNYLKSEGTLCDVLPHGAEVFEVDNQNVCITTGLTYNPKEKGYRQLIFFPPDMLTTSWENPYGGRIL